MKLPSTLPKIRRFESAWTKYVEALDDLDVVRGRTEGHVRRTRIAAGKRVRRLEALLRDRYGMVL